MGMTMFITVAAGSSRLYKWSTRQRQPQRGKCWTKVECCTYFRREQWLWRNRGRWSLDGRWFHFSFKIR